MKRKMMYIIICLLLNFTMVMAYQTNCENVNYGTAEVVIAIHNLPQNITQYKVMLEDGTWVIRNTAMGGQHDIKIKINTDGVTIPSDSTLLNLSENTSASILIADIVFAFTVGAKANPDESPDTKFELDYNTPSVIDKCTPGGSSGFQLCELTYIGKAIMVDQKFLNISTGNIRLTKEVSNEITSGNLKKVPYLFYDHLGLVGGLFKKSAQIYSIISVDSVNRYFHDWEYNQNLSFNYIKPIDDNNNSATRYEATQLNKFTFTPSIKIDGVSQSSGFKFIDPWFVDTDNIQKPTLLRDVGSNQHIFRGETPQAENPNKPYYKVKKSTDFNGISLQFSQWSGNSIPSATPNGNGEYPIVFSTSLSSFNTTAEYKGILTSNTPNWVENNMENFNGTEAVLYPSMNELWLHIEEIS